MATCIISRYWWAPTCTLFCDCHLTAHFQGRCRHSGVKKTLSDCHFLTNDLFLTFDIVDISHIFDIPLKPPQPVIGLFFIALLPVMCQSAKGRKEWLWGWRSLFTNETTCYFYAERTRGKKKFYLYWNMATLSCKPSIVHCIVKLQF